MELTHFDEQGNAWMVDVSDKDYTHRIAVAEGFIAINDAIYDRIQGGTMKRVMFCPLLNWLPLWGLSKRVTSSRCVIL